MATSTQKNIAEDWDHYLKAYGIFVSKLVTVAEGGLNDVQDNFLLESEELKDLIGRLNAESLKILVPGSGSGYSESVLIRGLLKECSTIEATVVEPTGSIQYFRTLATEGGPNDVKWDWRQQTWQEYWKTRGADGKVSEFHIILTYHMLYHLPDLEQAITDMMSCLVEGGLLVIVLVKGEVAYTRVCCLIPSNRVDANNACSVRKILEKHRVRFSEVKIPLYTDITALLEEDNGASRLCLDYLAQVCHFRETAQPAVVSQFMESLRSEGTSLPGRDGVFLDSECSMIIAES